MISSNIRVPKDIWEKLKIIADKEQRSMNSQIVYLIQKCVEEQEKKED